MSLFGAVPAKPAGGQMPVLMLNERELMPSSPYLHGGARESEPASVLIMPKDKIGSKLKKATTCLREHFSASAGGCKKSCFFSINNISSRLIISM